MTLIAVLAVGLGSFAFRVGPLLLLPRLELSERTDRFVRHAGAAVITALIVTSARSAVAGSAPVAALGALAVGVVLAARNASMLRIILCGGAIYAGGAVAMGLLAR